MGSEQTVRTYEHILTAYTDYARMGRPRLYLTDMSHTMIERWFAMLANRDRPKHNTRIQYCSVVSRFWEWSARRYPGRVAPFVKAEMPRKLRRKKVAPSWEEMDACIIAARQGAASPRRKPQDRGWVERMLTIMRFTGLRVRQTSLLTWEDFDLERGLLHVPAETEKTRVGRIIPISQHLIGYLMRIEPGEGRLFRRAWVPEAKWVNRCWRAAGVRDAIHGWHAFRRGFETGLLGPLGVDLVLRPNSDARGMTPTSH
jgi:integrase